MSPISARPTEPMRCARIGENILTIAWVRAFAGVSLPPAYRFALEHLVVAEPERVAADADVTLTQLQQLIAANQLVPVPHFAAAPVDVAAQGALVAKDQGLALRLDAALRGGRARGAPSAISPGSGASARSTIKSGSGRRLDDQPVGRGDVLFLGQSRVLLPWSSDRARSRGVRRRGR